MHVCQLRYRWAYDYALPRDKEHRLAYLRAQQSGSNAVDVAATVQADYLLAIGRDQQS